jgi:hypothetical protein
MEIKKAVRSQAKIKIALEGVSGSGKTYSALQLAQGMAQKILVVDTENGSASLYADQIPGGFDVIELKPPYKTEAYIEAIDAAIANGYDCVILDSISHAWAGEGGLLQQKETIDATNKTSNQYANWKPITQKQEAFVAKILHSDINIIATMRSKQAYVLENVNGKNVPKKMGLEAVQRDGVEYEFTIVFELDLESHNAIASKNRTPLFKGEFIKISPETGKAINTWLSSAVVFPASECDNLKKEIRKFVADLKISAETAKDKLAGWAYMATEKENIVSLDGLTEKELKDILFIAKGECKK